MKNIFESLHIPPLPMSDLAKLGDGSLTNAYEKLGAEIRRHNGAVEEVRGKIDALSESDSVSFEEVQASKSRLFELAIEAVSLARRREELKPTVGAVHRRFAEAAQERLAEVREQKTIELRRLCGGSLPWNWENTLGEACLAERREASWRPALLQEQVERPELAPPARTREALRALVEKELF